MTAAASLLVGRSAASFAFFRAATQDGLRQQAHDKREAERHKHDVIQVPEYGLFLPLV